MKRFIYRIVSLVFILTLTSVSCSISNPKDTPFCISPVEIYFSPQGGIRDKIINVINLSKSNIDIAIFDFTSNEVAQALKNAKERGVNIRLIMDSRQAKGPHSQYEYFKNNGFEVRLKKGKGQGIMHNKVCIFDNRLVMTGSYNISENAERFNYENVVFISDKNVIQKYQEMFEKLWNE